VTLDDAARECAFARLRTGTTRSGLDARPDVKILRRLRDWLREFGEYAAPTTPLFRSNRGTRVSYDALHYRWAQVCKSARLVDVVDSKDQLRCTIYQLRHRAGTELISQYSEQIQPDAGSPRFPLASALR
jgi:hypothetical protein